MKALVTIMIIVLAILAFMIIKNKNESSGTPVEYTSNPNNEPTTDEIIDANFGIRDPETFYPDAPAQ